MEELGEPRGIAGDAWDCGCTAEVAVEADGDTERGGGGRSLDGQRRGGCRSTEAG
jgi:hypothetical protein